MSIFFEALASGGGSDWFHVVVIHAPNGANVTVSDGDEDIETTVSGIYAGIPVHDQNSTYTVEVEMSGFVQSDTFTTGTTSGQMTELSFDFGTINLTFDDNFRGQSATVSDGGTNTSIITLPSTGNTEDIRVPEIGTYTITSVDPVSGDTFESRPATVTDLSIPVSTILYVIPDGSTVVPTDDIETWLFCANIKDTGYTTLGEVLYDEEVLYKLLTDDNANDYLVRSKSFGDIGIIPKMTTNTTPEGRAFSSSAGTDHEAYKAFDKDDNTSAQASATSTAAGYYLGYIFPEPKEIRSLIVNGTTGYEVSWKVQYSNDTTNGTDGTWTDAGVTFATSSAIGKVKVAFSTVGISAKAWRIYVTSVTGASYFTINSLNFNLWQGSINTNELAMSIIGADDYASDTLLSDEDWKEVIEDSTYYSSVYNISVPTMISDTTPKGQCIENPKYSGTYAYPAFDKDLSTYIQPYASTGQTGEKYIGYVFERPVVVKECKLYTGGPSYNYPNDYTFDVYGSNDGITWSSSLGTFNITAAEMKIKKWRKISLNNNTAYRYYKLSTTNVLWVSNNYAVIISEVDFINREAGGVQSWLKAAELDRPHTSLQDVLDDKPTLQILMTNHAAVDYLVTAKGFIDGITSDESAMKYIGRRNYASETLLSDSDWSLAISESNYWDKVLSPSVPTLAADSAKVIKSSELTGSEAWTAFDNVDSSGWAAVDTASGSHLNNAYIGYDFDEPILVNRIQFDNFKVSASQYTFTASLRIEGSNDGFVSDVHDLSGTITTSSRENIFNLSNDTKYRYYRVFITDFTSNSQAKPYLNTLQFYGRADVDESIIDIYSAASDNDIYYMNAGSPVNVAYTDPSGFGTLDKDDIADGVYDLYSTVAKDPDTWVDGTAYASAPAYHKKVRIDENTIEINLMPDNTQYWFGNNINTGDARANGYSWSVGLAAGRAAVYNALSVSLTSGASDGNACGVGIVKPIKSLFKSHVLGTFTKSGNYGPVSFWSIRNGKSVDVAANQLGMEGYNTQTTSGRHTYGKPFNALKAGEPPINIDDDVYFTGIAYYSGSGALYGIYYDKKANFFSAANDTVYYEEDGAQVILAHTDKYGEAIVDYTLLPEGDYTLYSSVAKNPDDLTRPYSKTVRIRPGLRNLYFMPDYTLYWYGYKSPNMEIMNAANGWTTSMSNYSYADPTFNANSVTISAASNQICGISSKIPLTNKRLCMIGKGTGFTCINLNTKNIPNSPGFDNAVTDTTLKKYATRTTDNDKSTYKIAYVSAGRSMEVNALYCDTPNVFSAANDTIYYEAAGGSQVVVAETNDQGEALIDISAIPNGTYIMYSSVAKDPDDLTQPYHKEIVITDDTKEIRLMPDNAIYWYGWKHELAYDEYDNVRNGWTAASTTSFGNLVEYPTGTDNIDFSIPANAYNTKCLSYGKQLPTGAVVKSVGYCNRNQAYFVAGLTASTTKKCEGTGTENQAAYFPASSDYSVNSMTLIRDAYLCWLSVHQTTGGASAINAGLKALWYEN